MSFRNYYDSSTYGRSRDTSRSGTYGSSTRPTTVTAKYVDAPTYKSSSIPIFCSDRNSTRDETLPTIGTRYANYNKTDKSCAKYDRKDYSKLSVPTINLSRSRDVSPVSSSSLKYNINRTPRNASPNTKTSRSIKDKKQDTSPNNQEKDIPNKTEKSTGFSNLSNFKLYHRTSTYNRPSSRVEAKPEITVNRYAIASRLSQHTSNFLSSSIGKSSSVSPVNVIDINKTDKTQAPQSGESDNNLYNEINTDVTEQSMNNLEDCKDNLSETVTVITRHTSPTPPGSSVYVRTRRADMAKTIEKKITRKIQKPDMADKEVQSDRLDDTSRTTRFTRTNPSNWSAYTPSVSSYTGYAGRYSTQYSNLRENSTNYISRDRCSRSRSTEPLPKDSNDINQNNRNNDNEVFVNNCTNTNPETISVRENNTNNCASDIIINVNVKLKKPKTSLPVISGDDVLTENIISNSQLPPQPPKTDGMVKIKKIKARKTSTESSSDNTSKKKIFKKRSKSNSSTDSDHSGGTSKSNKQSKTVSSSSISDHKLSEENLQLHKKTDKTRQSNSPGSSTTFSNQSSLSDDEVSNMKIKDLSRTSVEDTCLPTDPLVSNNNSQKNENGTEEAKSFLIRALAPVTNLFIIRQHDTESNSFIENSTSESTSKDVSNLITESDKSNRNNTKNIIASNEDSLVKLKCIRHISSGERAWWLDSDQNDRNSKDENGKIFSDKSLTENLQHQSTDRIWWSENNSHNKFDNQVENEKPTFMKVVDKHIYSEDEKPWWLDNNAKIPDGIERLTPSRKSSNESDKSEKYNFFKLRHIESGDKKEWWITSDENSLNVNKSNSQNNLSKSGSGSNQVRRIRHMESGERPWWLSEEENILEVEPSSPGQDSASTSEEDEVENNEPLGDRRSPEGLETPKINEEYSDHILSYKKNTNYGKNIPRFPYQKDYKNYISRFTDIDDILGTSGYAYSPFIESIFAIRNNIPYDKNDCEEIDPTQVRIHDSTPQRPVIRKFRCSTDFINYHDHNELDDATLQVFKDGDYGPYLDLESTLGEQEEELEGLQENRKNAIVLRTQLSVRVHAIIDGLLHSQGRELRRALFTLKQILQSDKDLIHEFVANKGLDCLLKVGSMADHNILEYILRALGQILLYVDGMHGVMRHKPCIQWIYSLIGSMYRHVVKTALNLLVIFVEYTESNCLILIDAINTVDSSNGRQPWSNIMKILQDFDASDTELLIYASTLINRCLNDITDRDIYFDQVDTLQDQGINDIIQFYMSKQGTDLDLLRQLQIFEAVLHYEEGDESGMALKQLDESIISSIRKRNTNLSTSERRKSKRQLMREKGNQRYTPGLKQRIHNGTLGHTVTAIDATVGIRPRQLECSLENKDDRGTLLQREHSIKDITQRLISFNATNEEKFHRVGDMAGIVLKAKEELAKSQSKELTKVPVTEKPKITETKVSESELHWDEIKKSSLNRDFRLCDLDFSDLRYDSDDELPLPAINIDIPPPPPPGFFPNCSVPPPPPPGAFPPDKINVNSMPQKTIFSSDNSKESDTSTIKKNKKTVKLFWREVQENPMPVGMRQRIGGFIWDDLPEVDFDIKILEHLFESRTNDLIIKEKLMDPKIQMILDAKRSNAINIAMKKLPTPQTIKAAIMKMDATVIGREGIEKLLTMLPTEEEKIKIQEAQYANPGLPLGSAEQFLLTLASINELSSRLKLWVFKLDFDNLEKEIAEPLMDLKQGIELLKVNKTFKIILSTLRSVGSFLNGSLVKGFRLEYLSKVMEVKDTVHKHPLLHHICDMIIDKFPDSTDFFSEVGPVIRVSKVDFDVLNTNLTKLELDCKASWDHMKKIAKHDSSQMFKTKINDFLTDAAGRIILLSFIKNKVMKRYTKFLLYLGVPPADIPKTKPSEFLKVIAEFALEYRTSRERVLQQLEKKANHRERNKTRGKLIIDVGNYSKNNGDHAADKALKELLKSDPDTDSLTNIRRKNYGFGNKQNFINGDLTGDDEIIESLVRSSTSPRHSLARVRRKNRLSDKKNWNRTLDGQQS